MTEIVVDNGIGDSELTELDLSRFSQLKRLEIGDYCCMSVNELKLIGLSELERVVIGENSFVIRKDEDARKDSNCHFHLKNCPKLKELRIGRGSFSDYSVCEIENVDALEVIEMGKVYRESSNFRYASLELKGVSSMKELQLDMPSLKSLTFGDSAFQYGSRVVLASAFVLSDSQNRPARAAVH